MAGIDQAKRALLRGRLRSPAPLTPPWALDRFADRCTRCGDCIRACPERVLAVGQGGFPTLDFHANGCTFCGACVSVCAPGALSTRVVPVWSQVARLSAGCLTQQGVYCQSCRDACPASAIAFRPRLGNVPQPRIDATRCTGCGACVSACPSGAIDIRRIEETA